MVGSRQRSRRAGEWRRGVEPLLPFGPLFCSRQGSWMGPLFILKILSEIGKGVTDSPKRASCPFHLKFSK